MIIFGLLFLKKEKSGIFYEFLAWCTEPKVFLAPSCFEGGGVRPTHPPPSMLTGGGSRTSPRASQTSLPGIDAGIECMGNLHPPQRDGRQTRRTPRTRTGTACASLGTLRTGSSLSRTPSNPPGTCFQVSSFEPGLRTPCVKPK